MSERRGRGRPPKGHVPLTVYVPPAVRQLIEEEAARADQTLGEVVATLVGDALPRVSRVDAHEENYQMDGKSPLSIRRPR